MSILECIDRSQIAQDALLAQYGSVTGALDLLDNRDAGQLPPRYGMWLSAFDQAAGQKGGNGYSSFNYRTTGVPFGFDFALSDNLIPGPAFGQSFSNIIRDQATGGTEGTFSTMYGTYFTQNAHVEAVLSYGRNQYINKRVMNLGEDKRVATSRHNGEIFSAALETRYGFNFDDLKIEPFSSVHYGRLIEDGFRETGAGSLNLIVKKRKTESLVSQLGFRIVRLVSLDSGKLIPEFTAAWTHDFTASGQPLSAAFAGAPDASFKLNGKEAGQEGFQFGGALTFIGEKNFSATAGFNTELGKNRQAVSGLLQFQYKW
jgi:outer membrane autotransporter protein